MARSRRNARGGVVRSPPTGAWRSSARWRSPRPRASGATAASVWSDRMRLKRLVARGFKSFADRTEFEFDTRLTGIIGPNGCGKSNVVDAIKWVLGDQRAKSLRGSEMTDVIFKGAEGREAMGMAEVTITFEDPQGRIEGRNEFDIS